jgi:membrane protease YdiL (CAAX protease family)
VSEKPARVDWLGVVLYYVLACAVSWPFFWWRDMHPASWRAWKFPDPFKASCYMWGPGLAALAVLALRRARHHRTITFSGFSRPWSLAFFVLPLVALGIAYAPLVGARAAFVGVLAVIGFFNILGEELGWRGYLQDALRPVAWPWRYLTIGILWEFWHFTNRLDAADPWGTARGLLVSYPTVIALAAMIGAAADRARSLVVAVTLHFWIDALFEVPRLVDGPGWPTYLIFGLSLIYWAVLLWKWPSHLARGPVVTKSSGAQT